ncbi:MAG: hypothetical protein ACO395_07610 [Pontimonas sp.]
MSLTFDEIKRLLGVIPAAQAGPIPEKTRSSPIREYPHEFMEVGEAFDSPMEHLIHVSTANAREGRRLGRKFTLRANYPTKGTLRTWRVS